MLEIVNLTKVYGTPGESFEAVSRVSFSVKEGEFFSLLGPSGCGKTTLLRLIAGGESPTSGNIVFKGKVWNELPPQGRQVHMVFQRYALFPHLTVFENVAFGLRIKRVAESDIKKRVEKVLDLVQLAEFGARKIPTLSGGQQQRVAVARAVVNEPSLLLLDEPLSALDLKLRQQMQSELRSLQKKLGITFIYVTHDQEEAMHLSDRVAVMSRGKLQQVGTPQDLYEKPATPFVAEFVGSSNQFEDVDPVSGKKARVFLRPEKIRLLKNRPDKGLARDVIIEDLIYSGPFTQFRVREGERLWTVQQPNGSSVGARVFNVKDRAFLAWAPEDAIRFDSIQE